MQLVSFYVFIFITLLCTTQVVNIIAIYSNIYFNNFYLNFHWFKVEV